MLNTTRTSTASAALHLFLAQIEGQQHHHQGHNPVYTPIASTHMQMLLTDYGIRHQAWMIVWHIVDVQDALWLTDRKERESAIPTTRSILSKYFYVLSDSLFACFLQHRDEDVILHRSL